MNPYVLTERIDDLLCKTSETISHLASGKYRTKRDDLVITFNRCLEELWENINLREDNWGDLLNILQGVLAQVEFELLSGSQKSGIKKVVTECLCKAEVVDSDMEDALGILSQAGFDCWFGLSNKADSDIS